jgi:hypothetical protein
MSREPLPLDFLQQLEMSLDVDRETALATLADWLLSYEPLTRRESAFSSERPAPAVRLSDLRRVA